jgi:hypothetical protein
MEIRTKEALIVEIKNAGRRVLDRYEAVPSDQFFVRPDKNWSASDNVDHLVKSIKPVVLALRMPRFGLRSMFGRAEHPSRTYAEMCKAYEDEIARGAQASGRFLPDQHMPAHAEEQKKRLLERLSKANLDLLTALGGWQDAELDQCQLPHPILGKLTLREMLFFTVYHTLRHARLDGD